MTFAMSTGLPSLGSSLMARVLKFGYANSRVKAMKASLLGEKEMKALMDAKSVDEVFSIIEKTQYRPDLVGAALREKTVADQIELALSRNFSGVMRKILRITPKEVRPVLLAMFEKYEINNVKIILLAKHLGQAKEQYSQYITDVGVLSKGRLNKVIDAKGMKEAVIELGGTDYGRVLGKAMKEYDKDKDAVHLLTALDDCYYSKLVTMNAGAYGSERVITKMARAQADAKNISGVLRAKKEGLSEGKAMKAVLGHGTVSIDKLRQAAAAKNVEEAAKHFERNFSLGKAIESYKKSGSIIPLETAVEKAVAKKGLKLLRNSVLSVGAIAGFLSLKEEEVSNIRKIVRAKEFGIPAAELQEMIVQVW